MLIAPSPIPRFSAQVPEPVDVLMARAEARRGCHEPRVYMQVAGRHLELLVDAAERHYWSPWLSVTLEPAGAGQTEIHGRFGPHPAVWTLFVSIQIFWLFVLLCAVIAGISLATLGWSLRWPLWVAPGAVLGMFATYAGSLVGQRLGEGQIDLLRAALDDALQVRTCPAPARPPRSSVSGRPA